MPFFANRISNLRIFKTFVGNDGLISRFKTLNDNKKIFAGATMLVGILEYVRYFKDVETGYKWLAEHMSDMKETRARRKMIGIDVAHGLAWSHYCGFLQHVLPEIEQKIDESKWFKELSEEEKKKFPKKLYELIPRKCYVDIPGNDANIIREDEITIEVERTGNNRKIKIQIYSIKDGETKYYCLCDCPHVLKTINTMHDTQLAGISRSKVQLFNVDTKLVQLMRFYYAMSSLLSSNNKQTKIDQSSNTKVEIGKKVRLLLFNESDQHLSSVLLQAIKEDLTDECKNKKTDGSLMENKLLSAEERKDILYDFDVYVTPTEAENDKNTKQVLEKISGSLKDRNMKILLEKDCLGKDWLERIKYAATKCRWIVFLENKESESKYFIPSNAVASLKSILELRKVQTIAIVNKRDNCHIHDDLRWVTCIPHLDNEKYLIETLHKVVSGSEVKLNHSQDLYLKPGEAAVGLAWSFAVNYLNMALPELELQIKNLMDGIDEQLILKKKLFIVVPKSCQTKSLLDGVTKFKETEFSTTDARSYRFYVYKLDESKRFVGQYASPVDAIRKMNERKLIDDEQMKVELDIFYNTVKNIMKILYPEKANYYEFIYYDDTKESLPTVLSKRVK